uniref:Ubiquitin-conjugating enzyme E2 G2 n=1 Tax=Culex pipiens TaxID=7175 RepID=A0A8D8CAN2_CULPI
MAGSALRRLMAEYRQLTLNPIDSIIAGPISEENFFEWEALITGPEGTCFEGGVFTAKLVFPPDYPLSPPKMRFTCEMFHPNSMFLKCTILLMCSVKCCIKCLFLLFYFSFC